MITQPEDKVLETINSYPEEYDQIKKTALCYGTQLVVVPSYKNNHRAKFSDKTGNLQNVLVHLRAHEHTNYLILASSPTHIPNTSYLVIDFDDHNHGNDKLSEAQRASAFTESVGLITVKYKLDKDTLVIKTPSGHGRHFVYIIPTDVAEEIGRWSIKLLPNVEVKIGSPKWKTTFPGPGTRNDSGRQYIIEKERQPKEVSEEFIRYLLTLKREEIKEYKPPSGEISSNIDDEVNVRNAEYNITDFFYIKSKQFEKAGYPKGIVPNGERNETIYQLAREISRYNLSLDKILELTKEQNYKRLHSPLDDWELEATVRSAYNITLAAKEETTRVKDGVFTPYEKDEKGNYSISYKVYEEKVKHINDYEITYLLDNQTLTEVWCSTIFHVNGMFYVPKMHAQERFEETAKMYDERESNSDGHIEINEVTDALSKTSLHFESYSIKDFNSAYKVRKQGTQRVTPVFESIDFRKFFINVDESRFILEYCADFKRPHIYSNKFAYIPMMPAIKPIPLTAPQHLQPTEAELEEAGNRLKNHFMSMVDVDNAEEEIHHILQWFAIQLQNGTYKTENILMFIGDQNTGKSIVMEVLRPLFPSNYMAKIDDVQHIESTFDTCKTITIFDDVHFNKLSDKGATLWNKLKSTSTASIQTSHKKFKDISEIKGVRNYIFTTNEAPNLNEISTDRRTTQFFNTKRVNINEKRKEVRDWLLWLKGSTPSTKMRGYVLTQTYLCRYPISGFNAQYKTKKQLKKLSTATLNDKFLYRLVFTVLNDGMIEIDGKLYQGFPFGTIAPRLKVRKYFDDIRPLLVSKEKKHGQILDIYKDSKDQRETRELFESVCSLTKDRFLIGNQRDGGIHLCTKEQLIEIIALYDLGGSSDFHIEQIKTKFGFNSDKLKHLTPGTINPMDLLAVEELYELENMDSNDDNNF